MSAREVVAALGGRWCGDYGMAQCPVHEDRTASLKISDHDRDDGIDVHCFAGCDFRDVKDALRRQGLLPEGVGKSHDNARFGATTSTPQISRQAEDDRKRITWARSIWEASETAQDSPVERYLVERGIHIVPPTLRHHRGLKHSDTGQCFSAMVAAVTKWPERDVVGIHRTYLQTPGPGKAQVLSPKKMGGVCGGGAVRLAPVDAGTRALGLAEGIETALSVQQATGIPMWACLSAGALRTVVVPNHVKEIRIFADNDARGIAEANAAADRFIDLGKSASVAVPPMPGQDFNDILMETTNGR